MDIKGRTVIVTGGGRGIGRAIALELAGQGANVVVTSRSEDQIRETAEEIESAGGSALAVRADVTCPEQVQAVVEQALERFGQVDVLVNNAGSFRAIGPVWEVDPEVWWSDHKTNVFGAFLCCQAVLPGMMERKEGIIINLCGGGADRPFLGASGYGSSKTGLMRLTDTLAFELERAGHAIQVYGFDPGLVRSEMTIAATRHPAAENWIPGMREWLETGMDHPVEESATALAKLIRISCPAITGRIFTYAQNFAEIERRAEDIRARDTYQIRYLTHM